MDIKGIGEWITVIGATVAAIASVWNLALQVRGKRDRLVVGLGSVSPSTDEETLLHVVSYSDHPIKLSDWGFIEADGRFSSIVMDWETGTLRSAEVLTRGSSELVGFGSHFESGCVRREAPSGAYAVSITRRSPFLYFDSAMPRWRRLWIRVRLWFQPHYLSW